MSNSGPPIKFLLCVLAFIVACWIAMAVVGIHFLAKAW